MSLITLQIFDFEKFCSIIQEYGITSAPTAPSVVVLLAKSPIVSRYDLSSLRVISSAGAHLSRHLIEAVFARIGVPVKQNLGLTEALATHSQPFEKWHSSIGSVGFLLPNQIVKYISADGSEVPIGQPGELCIKGPNIFRGYLNDIEATRKCFTEDGYFKTGDLGYQDEYCNSYIRGRISEQIEYKGFKIAPTELEGALITHPNIKDAAVIGIQDDLQATEIPRAYVVLQDGIEETDEESQRIIEWFKDKVKDHEQLRGGIKFIKEIPKSNAGKILRRRLRQLAEAENSQVQHQ